MAKNNNVAPFKLGDRVKIRLSGGMRGRIVELRGPLGPGGALIFRVRTRRKPKPAYIEVREDQLVLIPEDTSPVEPLKKIRTIPTEKIDSPD